LHLRVAACDDRHRAGAVIRSGFEKRGGRGVRSFVAMASITSITLEVPDPAAARRFYSDAFGMGNSVRLRASDVPTTGFRGFTVSLKVAQPSIVKGFVDAALDAGATALKLVAKSFWGYGGVVQAPDGTIWKVATSAKKDGGPATPEIDDIILLLGADDVRASKAVLPRPRACRGEELRPQVRRVRHPVEPDQAGALRTPRAGAGRRRRARRDRLAPARPRKRRRPVHGPRRVRVRGRDALAPELAGRPGRPPLRRPGRAGGRRTGCARRGRKVRSRNGTWFGSAPRRGHRVAGSGARAGPLE
jgi:catechol 2,3-dioxygenase-like lactoylglutathione lyase family enzyme